MEIAVPVLLGNTVNGKATLCRTEVKTCYDSNHIYFAIGAADPAVKTGDGQRGVPGTVDGIDIFLDVRITGRAITGWAST